MKKHDVSGNLASTTTKKKQISIDFYRFLSISIPRAAQRPQVASVLAPPSRSEASACVAVVGSAAFASSVARPHGRSKRRSDLIVRKKCTEIWR